MSDSKAPWNLPFDTQQWAQAEPWMNDQMARVAAEVRAGRASPCWLKGIFQFTAQPTMQGLIWVIECARTGAKICLRPEGYPAHFPDLDL